MSWNQAPAHYESVAKLIEEIKHLLLSEMEDSNRDLIKRLQIVDTLECLGIDRHFEHEIKTAALDYVYGLGISRYMNKFNLTLNIVFLCVCF